MTPANPPEVVVWAGSSFEKTASKNNEENVSTTALNFIEPLYESRLGNALIADGGD
jgi:hypothetical protein